MDDLLCVEVCVCNLPTSLDVSKSSGPDGISAKMLKYTAVSTPLPKFNISIKSGRVPEAAGNCHHLYQYPSQQNLNRLIITVIQTYISIVYTQQSVRKTHYRLIFKHLNQHYTVYLTASGVSEVLAPQYPPFFILHIIDFSQWILERCLHCLPGLSKGSLQCTTHSSHANHLA